MTSELIEANITIKCSSCNITSSIGECMHVKHVEGFAYSDYTWENGYSIVTITCPQCKAVMFKKEEY